MSSCEGPRRARLSSSPHCATQFGEEPSSRAPQRYPLRKTRLGLRGRRRRLLQAQSDGPFPALGGVQRHALLCDLQVPLDGEPTSYDSTGFHQRPPGALFNLARYLAGSAALVHSPLLQHRAHRLLQLRVPSLVALLVPSLVALNQAPCLSAVFKHAAPPPRASLC